MAVRSLSCSAYASIWASTLRLKIFRLQQQPHSLADLSFFLADHRQTGENFRQRFTQSPCPADFWIKLFDDLLVFSVIQLDKVAVFIHISHLDRGFCDTCFFGKGIIMEGFLEIPPAGPTIIPDVPKSLISIRKLILGCHFIILQSQVKIFLFIIISAQFQYSLRIFEFVNQIIHGFRVEKMSSSEGFSFILNLFRIR